MAWLGSCQMCAVHAQIQTALLVFKSVLKVKSCELKSHKDCDDDILTTSS